MSSFTEASYALKLSLTSYFGGQKYINIAKTTLLEENERLWSFFAFVTSIVIQSWENIDSCMLL